MADGYSIGALAKLGAVHVETIRFYERKGLLRQPERPYGSIRRYDQTHLARLQFIRRAQAAGFSLADVQTLIRLRERPSCQATRELTVEKLRNVEDRIAELEEVRTELQAWVARCEANTDEKVCPTLSAIERA
jgi:MerR family mercuric resistance operon transcriptional regulator